MEKHLKFKKSLHIATTKANTSWALQFIQIWNPFKDDKDKGKGKVTAKDSRLEEVF